MEGFPTAVQSTGQILKPRPVESDPHSGNPDQEWFESHMRIRTARELERSPEFELDECSLGSRFGFLLTERPCKGVQLIARNSILVQDRLAWLRDSVGIAGLQARSGSGVLLPPSPPWAADTGFVGSSFWTGNAGSAG